jgi:hypothetical protein
MADTTAPADKTPWHLWVVGIVSLLWNAMGATDFTMTQLKSEAWLKAFTPEQLAYIHGFPLWSVLAWGAGTWGSFLGSVLLLARKGLAFHFLAASLAGALLTSLYSFGLSDGLKIMGGGVGMIVFNAIIVTISVLLLVYAKNMRKRGVLR